MSRKNLVLVADDDPGNVILLQRMLENEGYEVLCAEDGSRVFEIIQERLPDLFLLDIMMPGLDGIEVCRKLKDHESYCRIPIIFITARDRIDDLLLGFEAGASDYIVKPFNKAETLARIGVHVKLYNSILELERLKEAALDSNPSTGLPGNNSIAEAISNAVADSAPLAVLYCDLDNFKAYNDRYGFARGDMVIKYTADVISESALLECGQKQFVGHIGGDDFMLVIPADKAGGAAERICKRFDEGVGQYYDARDLEAGRIVSFDRNGNQQEFPVLSISICVVDLTRRKFEHYLEVSEACAELKEQAKAQPGSSVFYDRREA